MPDLRISELPTSGTFADTDLHPVVQTAVGGTLETRRASFAAMRGAMLTDRGVHVRDYGARGDGSTNDAPAIQAAINDLQSRGGGRLLFGPRTYRLASAVSITNTQVVLQGAGFTEGAGAGQGTWLSIDSPAFTPFTFSGTTARGSAVRDIAVQQSHSTTFGPAWTPTAYPYVFRVEDCLGGVDFDNILLARVNRGIYARNSGRLDIRRLRGQVFTCGVEIDECLDVPRLHNLHFWTFWTADTNVVRWQQANGDALIFRRCDGVFVDQAFALGYRSMFRFLTSAAGAPPERSGFTQKFYIGQAYADFVRHGIWIEASGVDGQVAGLTTQGEVFAGGGTPIAGATGIQIDASNTRLQIGNLRVDDAEDNAVRVNGTGNRLDIASLRCLFFNTRNNGSAAVHLADSAAATPNAAYLAAPALLENGNSGPLLNAGTNALFALSLGTVRGTAAMAAQIPDGSATGGNARGANAVDWQSNRTTAAQVAGGANSVIAGGNRNTASANSAAVGGGQLNNASANFSSIGGGQSNATGGIMSWCPGGLQADTRSLYGKGVWASGNFSAAGDAQAGEQVLRRQTTDATQTRLTADNAAPGTANTVNLPNNGTFLLRLRVVARQTGGTVGTAGDSAGWDVSALVRRGANAASTAVIGGGAAIVPSLNDAAAAAWRLAVAADTTQGGLAVSGTGEANKSISWVARVSSVEAVG